MANKKVTLNKKYRRESTAKWTRTREEGYKKECDEILYRTKSKITIEDDEVFILTGTEKIYLLTIDNPKSTWFQIWLNLRENK